MGVQKGHGGEVEGGKRRRYGEGDRGRVFVGKEVEVRRGPGEGVRE